MAMTDFPVNHDLAVKRWSTLLAVDAPKESYFFRHGFVGKSTDNPITQMTELEKNKGDQITFGLRMKLSGQGVEGDALLTGNEEALVFYDDALRIDQIRHAVKSKGKASEQRVPYEMREEARAGLATWFGEWYDEQLFTYLSGSRGTVQGNLNLPLAFNGRAGNSLQAPPASRKLHGGNATTFGDLDSTDTLSVTALDKVRVKAKTLTNPRFKMIRFEGAERLVAIFHPFQIYDLQMDAGADGWLEIQKAAGERGSKNPLMSGALGSYKGIILHEHENIIRFSNAGAGAVQAARGLVLGAQAAAIAWGAGQPGSGRRFFWEEELADYGNQLGVAAGTICGIKKSVYNSPDGTTSIDYGVLSVDTACTDPNA